jgi:hypothetical protein
VEIDLVGQPGISSRIRRWKIVEPQRTAVREKEALPDNQRALLAESIDALTSL